ncbi:MAG TPA: hypothetical protein DCW31_08350, partial [Lactobacillus sp.]|nr:hypothetical protein [Lactobacillus sp.]
MGLIWSAVLAFLVTNPDDMIMLILFWGIVRTAKDRRTIIIGQYAGISTLVGASWLIGLGFMTVGAKWVGLLGLLPLTVGLVNLWRWFKRPRSSGEMTAASVVPGQLSLALVWSVTVRDGGDNLSVYIPFFVPQNLWHMLTIIAVFIVMTASWLWLSPRLVHTKTVGGTMDR